MNVGLNETDILVALETYVRSKYKISEDEVITFEFKAGRKQNGPSAFAKFQSDEIAQTHTAQYGTVLTDDDDIVPQPEETVSDVTVEQLSAPVTAAPVVETPPVSIPTVESETTDTIDIEEAISFSTDIDERPLAVSEVVVDTPVVDEPTVETSVDVSQEEEALSGMLTEQVAEPPSEASVATPEPFEPTELAPVGTDTQVSDLVPDTETAGLEDPFTEETGDPIASIFGNT